MCGGGALTPLLLISAIACGPRVVPAPSVSPELSHAHDPLDGAFSADDYREALALAVRFYGAQRCGDADNWLLVDNPSGHACHLRDGPAFRPDVDLVGGWHDAGDHLKFTRTAAWAAYGLLAAFDAWPDAFRDDDGRDYAGEPNGVPDVLDEVRAGTDWLILATPSDDEMFVQVGDARDHDVWVTSPTQSGLSVEQGGGRRPVLEGGRADVAGLVAAALAAMARAYEPYDEAYAGLCLVHARHAWAVAEANPGVTESAFYPDSTYEDALLCGAAELYRTTGEASMLDAARRHDGAAGSHGWVMGWAHNADPCRASLARAGVRDGLDVWRGDVARYGDAVSRQPEVRGLVWFDDWGTLRHAMSAAMSAALLYEYAGDRAARRLALSQLDWVLGDNRYRRSFVVGFGDEPPRRPHHRNAYGRDAFDWDLSGEPLLSLDGAHVGGPTAAATGSSQAGYVDDVADYVGNEVALDYNVGLVGTLAFAVHLVESRRR